MAVHEIHVRHLESECGWIVFVDVNKRQVFIVTLPNIKCGFLGAKKRAENTTLTYNLFFYLS